MLLACNILKRSSAPRLEAELLLAHLLHADRALLYCRWNEPLSPRVRLQYWRLVVMRMQGVPLAYITGVREFMSREFKVTPHVLIPRPETELLVEKALFILAESGKPDPLVVDVGTGSGAVAVSLACCRQGVRILATDISGEALRVAQKNAVLQGVGGGIRFCRGDLLQSVQEPADMITANLPYIPTSELSGLPFDVKCEPVLALDGGADGLFLYRRLEPQARRVLLPGGTLLAEIGGERQAREIQSLFGRPIWDSQVLPDWSGIPRVLVAKFKG